MNLFDFDKFNIWMMKLILPQLESFHTLQNLEKNIKNSSGITLLNNLSSFLQGKPFLQHYLNEYQLFPDQTGKLHFYRDLKMESEYQITIETKNRQVKTITIPKIPNEIKEITTSLLSLEKEVAPDPKTFLFHEKFQPLNKIPAPPHYSVFNMCTLINPLIAK